MPGLYWVLVVAGIIVTFVLLSLRPRRNQLINWVPRQRPLRSKGTGSPVYKVSKFR